MFFGRRNKSSQTQLTLTALLDSVVHHIFSGVSLSLCLPLGAIPLRSSSSSIVARKTVPDSAEIPNTPRFWGCPGCTRTPSMFWGAAGRIFRRTNFEPSKQPAPRRSQIPTTEPENTTRFARHLLSTRQQQYRDADESLYCVQTLYSACEYFLIRTPAVRACGTLSPPGSATAGRRPFFEVFSRFGAAKTPPSRPP